MNDSEEVKLIVLALHAVTEIQDTVARLVREALPLVAEEYSELVKARREVRAQLKQGKLRIVGRNVIPNSKAQSLIIAALGEAAMAYDCNLIDPNCSVSDRFAFQKQATAARALRTRIETGEIHIADWTVIA